MEQSTSFETTFTAPDVTTTTDTTPSADDLLVDDELLVEEISIDGMCGVY